MRLVEYGFSLQEIESLYDYDIREVRQLKEQVEKNRQMNTLLDKLNICDAVLHGMAAISSKKGYSLYKRWHNKIISNINRLIGKETRTVWDKMRRRSNRI